jgi:RNA polymerase sigma-70 factor (ECF subfamily)
VAQRFEELVAQHRDRVFRVALSVFGPGGEGEAEEVAQEVFVRLHRSLASFRGESALSTWLHRIAFNLAVDRRRLARWRKPHLGEEVLRGRPAPDGDSDPQAAASARQRQRAVRLCLEGLSARNRSVLYLFYWLDRSVAEIAEELELPAGTVKARLARGRERLGRCLETKGFEG